MGWAAAAPVTRDPDHLRQPPCRAAAQPSSYLKGILPGIVGSQVITMDQLQPWQLALQAANTALLRRLIADGQDPNELVVDWSGRVHEQWTPLHLAALNGRPDCCAELIKAGARLDAKARDGRTPLHLACPFSNDRARHSKHAIVELFLSEGADVHAVSNEGRTSLEMAAERCDRSLVKLLLRAGARIGTKRVDVLQGGCRARARRVANEHDLGDEEHGTRKPRARHRRALLLREHEDEEDGVGDGDGAEGAADDFRC